MRFKNDVDSVDSFSAQPLIVTPYYYVHIRFNTNQIVARYDNSGAKVAFHTL